VNDPWDQFCRAEPSGAFAGYFERAGGASGSMGRYTWSTTADPILSVRTPAQFEELVTESNRFLSSGAHRAILGYFGFDAVGLFEPALRRGPAGSPFPLGEFAFGSRVHRGTVVAPVRRVRNGGAPGRPVDDSLPRARFSRSVQRLRRDIRDGEAYQVVLAHRRTWHRPTDLLARAGTLRASERYAFFFYLRFDDRVLVGASPESVVEIDRDRATVNPIAGTLPAGRRVPGRRPLATDPKELAEHRMLVDLARNDLGRVARPGTVRVVQREERVRYARLEHLVSRVAGRLRPGIGPWEALAATFPAGTVSGAPKIRATELLRREEGTWRGPYAGAVGLLTAGPRADWALTIRSAFAAGPRLYTSAGAGIVYRSRPAQEFDETITKLTQVERSLLGGAA